MEKKEKNGNVVPGRDNFATILPGHIFKVPEIRNNFHPNSVVMYFCETLERVSPELWLIDIVLADKPGIREPIDLKKLNLSQRQKEELRLRRRVPKKILS